VTVHPALQPKAKSILSGNRVVAISPKKDIVGGWAKAARAAGLRFSGDGPSIQRVKLYRYHGR
jgi:hypothetical protein